MNNIFKVILLMTVFFNSNLWTQNQFNQTEKEQKINYWYQITPIRIGVFGETGILRNLEFRPTDIMVGNKVINHYTYNGNSVTGDDEDRYEFQNLKLNLNIDFNRQLQLNISSRISGWPYIGISEISLDNNLWKYEYDNNLDARDSAYDYSRQKTIQFSAVVGLAWFKARAQPELIPNNIFESFDLGLKAQIWWGIACLGLEIDYSCLAQKDYYPNNAHWLSPKIISDGFIYKMTIGAGLSSSIIIETFKNNGTAPDSYNLLYPSLAIALGNNHNIGYGGFGAINYRHYLSKNEGSWIMGRIFGVGISNKPFIAILKTNQAIAAHNIAAFGGDFMITLIRGLYWGLGLGSYYEYMNGSRDNFLSPRIIIGGEIPLFEKLISIEINIDRTGFGMFIALPLILLDQ